MVKLLFWEGATRPQKPKLQSAQKPDSEGGSPPPTQVPEQSFLCFLTFIRLGESGILECTVQMINPWLPVPLLAVLDAHLAVLNKHYNLGGGVSTNMLYN